jgi:hypothetical protein
VFALLCACLQLKVGSCSLLPGDGGTRWCPPLLVYVCVSPSPRPLPPPPPPPPPPPSMCVRVGLCSRVLFFFCFVYSCCSLFSCAPVCPSDLGWMVKYRLYRQTGYKQRFSPDTQHLNVLSTPRYRVSLSNTEPEVRSLPSPILCLLPVHPTHVCVCVCVYVYVYVYARCCCCCVCVRTYVRWCVCVCVCTYVDVCVCVRTLVCERTYV